MNMPEGWLKVYGAYAGLSEEATKDQDVLNLLKITRELAESLEMIRVSEQKKGTIGQYLPAWYVLRKYRELK